MTRTAHHPHATTAFPVYCVGWADDDTLILGGGGGATRSGIENKLKVAKVSKDGRSVKYQKELTLSNEEDAPMTLAVDRATKQLITGINASSSSIQGGSNDHCRIYSYGDEGLALVKGRKTIAAAWADDFPYQKLTALSPSSSFLAVGSTDDRVALLWYPSLEPAFPAIILDAELVDLDWGGVDGELLAITTVSALYLYKATSGTNPKLDLKQTIYPPSVDIQGVSFRSARFSRHPSGVPIIHAVLNATKARARGAPRKAFVCNFGVVAGPSKTAVTQAEKETMSAKGKEKAEASVLGHELGRWDVLVRREIASKPVTVFDVSSDGKLLAYGCSDLSLGILDATTLAPLLKILHAHSFPPTALKFNPSANLLVSASADHTIRAVVVPPSFDGISMTLIAFFIALIAIILALILLR